MMTRTKLFAFFLIFFVTFSVLSALFGETGFFVNRSLEKNYLELKYEVGRRQAGLAVLRESEKNAGLRNDGGYTVVDYIGSEKGKNEIAQKDLDKSDPNLFYGLSSFLIALISFFFSAFAVILWLTASKARKEKKKDDADIGGRYDEI